MIRKAISFLVPFIAMWLAVVDMAYGVETASEINNYTNNTLSLITIEIIDNKK